MTAAIVKPLPPELFTVSGSNAEMRWEAMRGRGDLVPVDRFFVRNHTRTPLIDGDAWRLHVSGSGVDGPASFSLRQLRRLPARTVLAFVSCAGNGRSYFTTQQGQPVPGIAWGLGAVGVARWRGVPLATVLRLAGLRDTAVDVMPVGLDPDWVCDGEDLGPVRRPIPIAKALDDVLLAYEMNGGPLPPDHGFPARVIVPSWVGIASIKWVGRIEVSGTPLYSPWNTRFYTVDRAALAQQVTTSALELADGARIPAGGTTVLRGRSWSGSGGIARVDVSTDGGATWRRARPVGRGGSTAWQRWELPWRPPAPGDYRLLARATDAAGTSQPDVAPHNPAGYQFGAVVRHPVTVR